MKHQDYKDQQKEILDKVLEVMKQDDRVLGVAVCGSVARNTNDAFSDIDVDCFMKEGKYEGVTEINKSVSLISPLLSKLWTYGKYGLFLFENGVRLDIHYWKDEEKGKYSLIGEKILYDPSGVIKNIFDKIKEEIPKHPKWNPEEYEYVDWMSWMFRQVEAWAYRGNLNGNKTFEKFSNSIDSLAQIRKALVEIRIWISGKDGYLKKIDEDFAKRIGQSYPHLNKEEIINCNRLLLEEWGKLIVPYCQKRKIEIPKDKIEKLKEMLGNLESVG